MAALREAGLTASDRGRAGPRERLHPRPDLLPGALRRADRLGDDHPQPVRALAGRALPRRRRPARGQGDHPGRRLRRPLLGRPAAGDGAGQGRPPRLPPEGWIEAGLEKLERVLPIAERTGLTPIQLACQWNLAHPAVECVVPTLIQEAGPEAPADRGEAGRAGGAARRAAAHGRGRRRDPRDRRQHRLHGAEGRQPRARGRGAPRPLAAQRRPRRRRRSLGYRSGSRPRRHSLSRHPPPALASRRDVADRREKPALVDPGRGLFRALHPDARLDRRRPGAAQHPARHRRQRRRACSGR